MVFTSFVLFAMENPFALNETGKKELESSIQEILIAGMGLPHFHSNNAVMHYKNIQHLIELDELSRIFHDNQSSIKEIYATVSSDETYQKKLYNSALDPYNEDAFTNFRCWARDQIQTIVKEKGIKIPEKESNRNKKYLEEFLAINKDILPETAKWLTASSYMICFFCQIQCRAIAIAKQIKK